MPEPITGSAFFPGGYGLWCPEVGAALPPFPKGGIMVLGHDFRSEAGYHESPRRGREKMSQPTSRVLLRLLRNAGIQERGCFFTNVYLGLRAGAKATRGFAGATCPAFVAHCEAFLVEQIDVQRPKLIITLGVHAPFVLARRSPDLADWQVGTGFGHLDIAGPVRSGVRIDSLEGYDTTVLAMSHPSLYHLTVRARRFEGELGERAGQRMLQRALIATKSVK